MSLGNALGSLTSVAQKAAQAQQTGLTAQQMAANAQALASSNTTAITALQTASPALGVTMLGTAVTFLKADLTLDGAWHSLQVPGVPSGASWMYVGGYVTNQGSPDNAHQKLYVRANGAGNAMLLSYTNGVYGSYEDDSSIGPCFVPCSAGSIQYNWSATVTDTNLVVYGYL